jgi:hypothetical protein
MRRCPIYMMLLLLMLNFSLSAQEEEALPSVRTVSAKVVDSLKQDADFAYANDESYLKQKKVEEQPRSSFWDGFNNFFKKDTVRTITYILLIAFFLFVIYRIIIVNNLFLFTSSKKIRTDDEQEDDAISDESLDDKINKAIRDKDYRSAIRYQYLKGLRMLSDRGWIRYHAQATNHDYVYQLSQHPVAGDFRFLTQVYDYVWYGEFALNDEQFTRLQTDFKRFYQVVK